MSKKAKPKPKKRSKSGRKLSPYQQHMSKELKKGKTFAEAVDSWKIDKKGVKSVTVKAKPKRRSPKKKK